MGILCWMSKIALVGAAGAWAYSGGHNYNELHCTSQANSEIVRFHEKGWWPLNNDESVLEVKRQDGSVLSFDLREDHDFHTLDLEKVVAKDASGRKMQPGVSPDARKQAASYIQAVAGSCVSGYAGTMR